MIRMLALALALTATAAAQAPRKLGAPTAKWDEPFTNVKGVRELKDGRVIVLDPQDKAIHLIDFVARTDKRIGREGDGPGEWRLPLSILALPGDSSAVNDMSRGRRFFIIQPGGEPGGLLSAGEAAEGGRAPMPAASDAAGRLYYHANTDGADSGSLIRWDRKTGRRDTVTRTWLRAISPIAARQVGAVTSQAAARGMTGRLAPRPFQTITQWAVAPDGRVAIVFPEPYHVMYIAPSGARIAGPTIAYRPVAVGEAEQAQYRRERERPVATISFSPGGQQTTSYAKPRYEPPDAWPEVLPAFVMDAVRFTSDGMLWVKRAIAAGAPPLYDVFDTGGKVAYQIELPADTQLAGFGAGSIYLVRVDDDDLQHLEKYPLPASRPIRP